MRMAGTSVQPAERMQLVLLEASKRNQHRVQRRGIVALRREEDVTLARPLLQVAHLVQEDPAHDVERAEARADVARPGLRDHVERVDPVERRKRARVVDRIQNGATETHELRNRHVVERVARDDVELLFTHEKSSYSCERIFVSYRSHENTKTRRLINKILSWFRGFVSSVQQVLRNKR